MARPPRAAADPADAPYDPFIGDSLRLPADFAGGLCGWIVRLPGYSWTDRSLPFGLNSGSVGPTGTPRWFSSAPRVVACCPVVHLRAWLTFPSLSPRFWKRSWQTLPGSSAATLQADTSGRPRPRCPALPPSPYVWGGVLELQHPSYRFDQCSPHPRTCRPIPLPSSPRAITSALAVACPHTIEIPV